MSNTDQLRNIRIDLDSVGNKIDKRQAEIAAYQAECQRIFDAIAAANETIKQAIATSLGLAVPALHQGHPGLLLSALARLALPEESPTAFSGNFAFFITPTNIYTKRDTISAHYGQYFEAQRNNDGQHELSGFEPFDGDPNLLQQAIARSLEEALPPKPKTDPAKLQAVTIKSP